MREIVTIQVGNFANYIGSHFWNFQDELLGLVEEPHGDPIFKNSSLDMDVLYRAGETQQGLLTYSPRLISVGFQGSLGSLSSSGSLFDNISTYDPTDIVTWTGNVSRCAAEPHKKNLFLQSLCEEDQQKSALYANDPDKEKTSPQKQIQDKDLVECLESGVQFWTDFSKVQYHPRSLYELHGSWTDVQKLDNYGIGKDVLSEGLQIEEMNERLRFFVEECDHVQGIQFIVDDSGGFSSVAAEYLENIADEYTNTPVLLYAARDPGAYAFPVSQKESITRVLHDAVSFSRLSSFCKLMVPVGLPSLRSKLSSVLNVDDQKLFHSSAVYAASIHSISIPLRMELPGPTATSAYVSGAVDVGEIVHILAGQERQNMVTILDTAMPAPSLTDEHNQGSIHRNLHPLTPEVEEDDDDLHAVESLIIHGALHSGDHRASISQVKDAINASYLGGSQKPKLAYLSIALCPLPIPLPFPSIFGSCVGRHGELLGNQSEGAHSRGSLEIDSIPMAARLRSSKAVMPLIERRLGNLRKHGTARGAPGAELLRSWGFGKDEVEDMGEFLSRLLMSLNLQMTLEQSQSKSASEILAHLVILDSSGSEHCLQSWHSNQIYDLYCYVILINSFMVISLSFLLELGLWNHELKSIICLCTDAFKG
ncbi:protein misato homolog 1 isoform X1 [Phoenix dactylifera]|uniref:Protein misato homolog 1 isoform X1 n=1 Tax=Phoenix dactylifera TaxID=42345 RepID=A0A8B7C6B7_PHODC|nr:protein misato homolog 1 isoform X1 [Phoenix dactylifera]XP_017698843.2 protein misato homolog 1 isoform X1 [Phoenix dactylifera]XP_026661238.2 protein misato homolog 1 isoform X1 [Phoenix dactylifera]XP_038970282.1 protein misato homolog 1 isoform X1 [Phoenix dactylifera]